MKSLGLGRYALTIGVTAALLAGCGGSQSPIGAPPVPQSHALAGYADHGGSWMLPEAKSQDLLYISASPYWPNGDVYVYTYPQGHLVGDLSGLFKPVGECADSQGNVFVVTLSSASTSSNVYEYAHGGTTPIATLSDPNVALSCAIDPQTGNLAAGGDGVAIFSSAQGIPAIYNSSFAFKHCGFDNRGDLYLSALSSQYGDQAQLIRLTKGSAAFQTIVVNAKLYSSARLWPSVQWDDNRLVVSSNRDDEPITFYRLRVKGAMASVTGATTVTTANNNYSGQTWIQGGRALAAGNHKHHQMAFLWKFPEGGPPFSEIRDIGGVTNPDVSGIVVSVAPRR